MEEDRWRALHKRMTSVGLIPLAGVREKLLAIPHSDSIVEDLISTGITGILTADVVQKQISISSQNNLGTPPSAASDAKITNNSGVDPTSKQDSESSPTSGDLPTSKNSPTSNSIDSKTEIGRVIAPLSPPKLKQAERPHGLPHFSMKGFQMDAVETSTEFDVHFDITGNSTTEGKLGDILSCFNSRLEKIKKMLVSSGRMRNRPINVNQLIRDKSRFSSNSNTATIVGLINDVRYKGDNLHFKIEDKTGDIFCVLRPPRAMDNSPAAKRRNTIATAGLMDDDVVGITGYISPGSKDMVLVEDIHLAPLTRHEKRTAPQDQAVSVAFLSDIHVGSHTFLHAQWEKMVNWFHTDPLARTIKYLVLSGDVVDGVGIYKDQDKELEIVDLYKQYEEMARLTEKLPEWVETIILPGNHDAVRPAEPQPQLDSRIQEYFNSAKFVGNPCDFSLHGVRVLAYHGVSIMDFVSSIRHVTFSQPETAMAEMLERRHLAPSWGGKTPLSPEPEDHMVIEAIPDIFVTGHVHGHYCDDYKGTTLIQSSTWQDQTGYMRMLGFQPKPCMMTVVNLHTHESATIPFA